MKEVHVQIFLTKMWWPNFFEEINLPPTQCKLEHTFSSLPNSNLIARDAFYYNFSLEIAGNLIKKYLGTLYPKRGKVTTTAASSVTTTLFGGGRGEKIWKI